MFEQMEKEDKVYGNLLNGEWVASASGETIGIYSPIDGSLLGSVQAMTREEVDQAVASTKDYIHAWSALPVHIRGRGPGSIPYTVWRLRPKWQYACRGLKSQPPSRL